MEEDKKLEKRKNIEIAILSIIIVALLGVLIYLLFIKKDTSSEQSTPQENQQANNISVKKNLEVFAFNVILDTNGNAYLDLREDNIDRENYNEIFELFNKAQTYNYNNKSEKLVKLNAQNIKDIQAIDFGNGGGKYIILLDNNDKLYALIDYEVENSGNIALLTNDKLNKVTKVYNECDEGGCLVYANAIINGKEEKVSLYDLFENIENYISMLNDGLRNLLFQELTPTEFRDKAKQFCTNDLITKLLNYYNNDTSGVCLNAGGCNVDGGYIGEVTDINYRDFRIVSKNDTIIEGIGVYGESKADVKEQKIRYKLDNGIWKIDDFDIKKY